MNRTLRIPLVWFIAGATAVFWLSVFLGCLLFLATTGHAHDIWSRAREFNKPSGFPCCGGDPMTGDCEGLGANDIWERADGIEFYSHRYKARVFVPSHRVHFDVPRDVNTGEPLDALTQYAAHWCGKPRGEVYTLKNADQPDPSFHTFCAFVNPGGS